MAYFSSYTFYQYLWFFCIYAFFGWCLEVVFHVVTTGGFVNRGFLNGPVCPIYGFGVVLVTAALTPLANSLGWLFLGSVLLTTALEWFTGFALEKLFHTRWWDYTKEPFNIGGYICLRFSLYWGVACVLVVDVLQPLVCRFVDFIPLLAGKLMLGVLLVYFAADTAVTASAVLKLNRRLARLDEMAARMHTLSEGIGEKLTENTLALEPAIEKGKALRTELGDRKQALRTELVRRRDEAEAAEALRQGRLSDLRAEQRAHREALDALGREYRALLLSPRHFRLLRAFPSIRSLDHGESMEKLKAQAALKTGQPDDRDKTA